MSTQSAPVEMIGRDPDALRAFYLEHVEAIGRFVARRTDDPHLAADLTTEIFMAAVDAAEKYRSDRGTPRGWLFGIARNVLAEHVRRSARERNATQRSNGRRQLDSDALTRIEERIDAERELRLVFRALAQLPERDRRLVELVAVDGLTVVDAAAVLGVKPATARVRLHRSRARVEQLIRNAASTPPRLNLQETT